VGASLTFPRHVHGHQADIDAGGVSNQALATGIDPNGTPVTDLSDESSPAVGNNDPTSSRSPDAADRSRQDIKLRPAALASSRTRTR